MNRIVFIGTDKNMETLHNNFNDWYDKTLARYRKDGNEKAAKALETIFSKLKDSISRM